jgi:predicted nucleic acid-binding protein
MTILDTDIIVALLKGTPDAIQKITSIEEKGEIISITIVTVYELLKGAYLSRRCDENLAKVSDAISSMQILDLTFKACEEAAKIYKELKNKGTMVGEFDILIAAITRANQEELVTRDEHFELLIPQSKLHKW